MWNRGSRVFAAGHSSTQRRRACELRASAMDFEDGKQSLWLVAAAGGRRGGRPGGLFTVSRWPCGLCSAGPEAARPPRAQCPESARVGTRAPCRSRPAPAAAGDLGVRAGLGAGKGAPRAPRPPDSGPGLALRTRPGRGAWKLPRRLQLPGVGQRGEWGLPCLVSHSPHRAATQRVRLVNPLYQVASYQFSEACSQ